jgi:hypothetical protein
MGKLGTAEVLRLRGPSAVPRDRSVRRSAQDDGFVGGDEKHPEQVSAYAPQCHGQSVEKISGAMTILLVLV